MTKTIGARTMFVKACCIALLLALMLTGVGSVGAPVALVNCGSYKNATVNGMPWESDIVHKYFSSGGTTGLPQSSKRKVAVADPEQAVLYSTYRVFERGTDPPYRYVIPVPAFASYSVDLHFAEMKYTRAGNRIMNVTVQGSATHDNLDVFVLAGGTNTPIMVTSEVTVLESGSIVIDFLPVTQNPFISAIGIYESSTDALDTSSNVPTFNPSVHKPPTDALDTSSNVPTSNPSVHKPPTDALETSSNVPTSNPSIHESPTDAPDTSSNISTSNPSDRESPTDALETSSNIPTSNPSVREPPTDAPETSSNIPTSIPSVHPTNVATSVMQDEISEPEFRMISLVNCGGATYVDISGKTWEADADNRYFRFGGSKGASRTSAEAINGTDDDAIYQSGREFSRNKPGPYRYQIPIPDADTSYFVDLHFAEINSSRQAVGRRRFSVYVEDSLLESEFDIVKAAGAAYTVAILSTTVSVSDGFLSIELRAGRFNPFISAIAVYQTGSGTPTTEPYPLPTEIPSLVPSSMPSIAPTQQIPSSFPSAEPSKSPSSMPSIAPTQQKPSSFPSAEPSKSPSSMPSIAPTQQKPSSFPSAEPSKSPKPSTFEPVLINSGGFQYDGVDGRTYVGDEFFTGGETYFLTSMIGGTADDLLYQTQRYGPLFTYDIPLPEGNYEIIVHLCELDDSNNTHVFDVEIGGASTFIDVDVSGLVGDFHAMTLETVTVITDGVLSLRFSAKLGHAFVSAIEINLLAPHLAHAVASGPYTAVDVNGTGFAYVPVDGRASHTHAPEFDLTEWKWFEGNTLVGQGELTHLLLSVGEHLITLRVVDAGSNESAETTTVTVLGQGSPVVSSLDPSTGDVAGMNSVTIKGFGFNFIPSEITVHFGSQNLTGPEQITVVDSFTILVHQAPAQALAFPVTVAVSTPIGERSNSAVYTYTSGQTIEWSSSPLLDMFGPTSIAFDHNKKLYIGTIDGKVAKLTLNDAGDTIVESLVSTKVADSDPGRQRSILGLAFDPMDAGLANPPLYLSHSQTFHGGSFSSAGGAINGKISRLSGANLDVLTDVVTGLPVSDHDHAVNALEFTDHGSILVLLGGNTNGGVAGALSGSRKLKDNVLSAAMIEVHISKPAFDGFLTYDAPIDGNLVGSCVGSVEVFASGLRSAYDFVIHSNGKIYATDNGSNLSYGDMSTSCMTSIPDIQEADKLLLVEKNRYYGHSNRKRGETDPRQCVWRSAFEPSDENYTAPLAIIPASSNGIVEFQSSAFGGQLRGNLLFVKYRGDMFRAILTDDGTALKPESNPPVSMVSSLDAGLDIVQGPDSKLYSVRYKSGKVRFFAPNEAPSTRMLIESVFPRRGGQAGGSIFSVYGQNLLGDGATTTVVSVGGNPCLPVLSNSATMIQCILPGGVAGTAVDILVTKGSEAAVFPAGYHYITGLPATV